MVKISAPYVKPIELYPAIAGQTVAEFSVFKGENHISIMKNLFM